MTSDTLQVQDRRNILALPLISFLIVGSAFFLIEHDTRSQSIYQDLVGAQTIDDVRATDEMFEQSRFRQLGGLMLAVTGAFFLLVFNGRASRALGLPAFLVVLFVLWNVFSLFWADDMALTFRRLLFFLFICIGAAGIALRWKLEDIMLFTMLCTGSFIAIGVGVEVYNGTFSFRESIYRFAGTLHPNAQAVNCALFIFSTLSLMLHVKRGKLFLFALILVGFAFLYLTKSRTALASTVAVLLIAWGLRQSVDRKILVGAFVAAGISFVMLMSAVFLPMIQEGIRLGRTEQDQASIGTLTGRTELWTQLYEFVGERPVLGFGYGGFWNEDRSWEVIEEQGWPISHAHNAYIDIMLDAGPIAALLYILVLLYAIRRAHVYYRATDNAAFGFLLMLLVFCALNGLLESVAIQRSLVTILSFIAMVQLAFFAPPREYEAELLQADANRRALSSPTPLNPQFNRQGEGRL